MKTTFETIFLGAKPKPDADTFKGSDLGKVLRSDKIKDLVVLDDEAHHIHDSLLAWFKSIEDISNKLKLTANLSWIYLLNQKPTFFKVGFYYQFFIN